MESLQDRLPPFSQNEAEAVIAVAGTPCGAGVCLASVRRSPAASIAQVHRGETEADGLRKSVAVERCGPMSPRVSAATWRFFLVAPQSEAHSAEARRLRLIGNQHDVALGRDGDGPQLKPPPAVQDGGKPRNDPDFRVPTVDWDRTTHNVLTMELIDGIALNDHARSSSQVDLPDLGRKVMQSFLRHALRDGFFLFFFFFFFFFFSPPPRSGKTS